MLSSTLTFLAAFLGAAEVAFLGAIFDVVCCVGVGCLGRGLRSEAWMRTRWWSARSLARLLEVMMVMKSLGRVCSETVTRKC